MRIGACGDPIYSGAGFYFGGVFYAEIPAVALLKTIPAYPESLQVYPAFQTSLKVITPDEVLLK